MSKDKNDDKAKRGRPVTGTALTNAEKQSAYRARKQKISVTVMISESEKMIVDQWVKNSGLTMSEVISTMIRLAKNNNDVDNDSPA
jgi:Replication regulatory protein RepB